ncbi:hypothetical protein DY000_02021146 [Brassica cretica]|uniref:Altered inheritance of mitochondria protein 41 n=1 Tax=Brassica cretica TaxID=69181 RepID=A0ABQ7EJW5_BRACR|nr:hypothetical protein DY000_02021146 [Brassica cretica]
MLVRVRLRLGNMREMNASVMNARVMNARVMNACDERVAAKAASGKRAIVDHEAFYEFQTMWSIKEKDLAVKERLSKMGLLERLIGKKEPLSEVEEALKDKLITEMLSDQPTKRPPGVKAAKAASGKRAIVDHEAFYEFQTMWSIKEKDLAVKERLSKMGLLERLIGKKEPLSEVEEALKDKLITEMLSN